MKCKQIKRKFILSLIIGGSCLVLFILLLALYLLFNNDDIIQKTLFGVLESMIGLLSAINFSLAIKISITINNDDHSKKYDIHPKVHGNHTILGGSITINKYNGLSKEEIDNKLSELQEQILAIKNNNVDSIKRFIAQELDNKFFQIPEINFLIKYMDDSSNISEEHIQKIWAKIFVQKTSDQNSVSKRLLDIVKNMSTGEAKIFEKFCIYGTDNGIILKDFITHLSFLEISMLQDLRLVKTSDLLDCNMHFNQSHLASLRFGSFAYIFVDKRKIRKELSMHAHVLTKEGVELKKALKYQIQINDLIKFGFMLKTTYAKEDIDVYLCPIFDVTEKVFKFKLESNLLEPTHQSIVPLSNQ